MTKIDRQKRQIEQLLAQLSSHQWDQAAGAFTGDSPAFEDVPFNVRLSGRSGIADAFKTLMDGLPDLKIEVINEIDQAGQSVRELIISGTHLGSFQGIEPSGRHVRLSCAAFFTFDSKGRLATERLYFDNETLRRQRRGPEIPYIPERLRVAA